MSTKIEWTEETWNPFVGCFIVSAGCTNCYAMTMAQRLGNMGQEPYQGTTQDWVWTGKVNRNSDAAFYRPLKVKSPRLWFVNSMSDFWHEAAKDEWRAEALDVMRRTPHHTYQILTKRPENIAPTLKRLGRGLPDNIWLGSTVEDHRVADRIAVLRSVHARIRFLSVEPMT